MRKDDVGEKIKELKRLLLGEESLKEDMRTLYGQGFSSKTMFEIFISRTIDYAVNDDEYVNKWIDKRLKGMKLHSRLIPIRKIDKWQIEPETGNISHDSGRFFIITGLKARHRLKNDEIEWDQPIIDQPEVGILGILAKKINGVLHFCLQAKEEPGNINSVQLSPTVQATYSNYTQVHGGRLPEFVEFFLDPPKEKILFSKLQSEDGGRFLFKSNRNMIVMVEENDIPELPDGFIWLTLRQIGDLVNRNNLVNYCTRSVLSCLI